VVGVDRAEAVDVDDGDGEGTPMALATLDLGIEAAS
jgi:hypothetical protein